MLCLQDDDRTEEKNCRAQGRADDRNEAPVAAWALGATWVGWESECKRQLLGLVYLDPPKASCYASAESGRSSGCLASTADQVRTSAGGKSARSFSGGFG